MQQKVRCQRALRCPGAGEGRGAAGRTVATACQTGGNTPAAIPGGHHRGPSDGRRWDSSNRQRPRLRGHQGRILTPVPSVGWGVGRGTATGPLLSVPPAPSWDGFKAGKVLDLQQEEGGGDKIEFLNIYLYAGFMRLGLEIKPSSRRGQSILRRGFSNKLGC